MKLLIVDDDDQIREGMACGIQWEDLGFHKAECCRNGMEALHILENETFDLVITDISMPVLSGIDLLKKIREKNIDTHFILISGYQEFEYAKAGIRYGADDYILKPIHLDELIGTVTKVLEKIKETQEDMQNRLAQKKIEQEKQISRILSRKIEDEAEIRHFLKKQCGFSRLEALIVVVVSVDGKKNDADKEERIRSIFLKKVTEYLTGSFYIEYAMPEGEHFLLVNVPDSQLLIFQMSQKIKEVIYEVNKELQPESISAGISGAGYPKDIADLYAKSWKALEERWIKGAGRCFFYQNPEAAPAEIPAEDWNQKIKKFIKDSDQSRFEKLLAEIKNVLPESNKENVRKYMIDSLYDIGRELEKSMTGGEMRTAVEEAGSYEEAVSVWESWLCDLYEEYDETKYYGSEIRQAMQYIRDHYTEKIMVEDIAAAVGISAGYFSRIFKKQVGISFIKYLNQYRIDKAEQLLKETNLKVYEVAEQVGVSDYIYFTQLFRSLKGTAPTDIKKMTK